MALSKIRLAVRFAIAGQAPPSSAPVINYTISRTTGAAPFGVMIDATATTSTETGSPFDELSYVWDYGDIGATFDNRAGVDANKSRGPIGGHVYESVGSNTITLTVMDNNLNISIEEIEVITQDPDVVFSGDKTFCVSEAGDFTNCPNPNASNHISSMADFEDELEAHNFLDDDVRFLFRSGEQYVPTREVLSRNRQNSVNGVMIGSYEAGEPIWNFGSSIGNLGYIRTADVTGFNVHGLDLIGEYNPATGLGKRPNPFFMSNGVKDVLFHHNNFSGLGLNLYLLGLAGAQDSEFQMAVDNNITKWQNYGILGNLGYLGGIFGNSIKQDVNAVSGTEGKVGDVDPNFPDHGPIRISISDHLLVNNNDLFNNAGWSSAGLAHQSCLRIGTDGIIDKSIVSDNDMEGGFAVQGMNEASGAVDVELGTCIIERNKYTATGNSTTGVTTDFGGHVYRNNLFIKPDNGGPSIGSGKYSSSITFGAPNSTAGNIAANTKIYNNTVIATAISDFDDYSFILVSNSFETFELLNNIVYAPNCTDNNNAGLISFGFAADLSNIVSDKNVVYMPNTNDWVWNNGVRESFTDWKISSSQDLNSLQSDPLFVSAGAFTGLLQGGSPAINLGDEIQGLVIDFYENDRDISNPDSGATEN